MSSATAAYQQTLTDIAVQYLGSVEAVYELAALNGLTLTDALTPGQLLTLPAVKDKRVARVLIEQATAPAADSGSLDVDIEMILQRLQLMPNSSSPRAEVLPNQTLTDIAVQYLGSVEAVYELAALNGLTTTDELTPGQTLLLPQVRKSDVAAGLQNTAPASGAEILEGIDYWMVELEFEVQ